jgi:MoxR-like ATPase
VLATQNPIEFEGTFPLPEAQINRFLLRLSLGYPESGYEDTMLQMQQLGHPIESLGQAVDGNRIMALQHLVRELYVSESVRRYILDLVHATRKNHALSLGASPRGSLALFRSAQVHAALAGRDFVLPDDVKSVAIACLAHRMVINPENALAGETTMTVVQELLRRVEVPLTVEKQ